MKRCVSVNVLIDDRGLDALVDIPEWLLLLLFSTKFFILIAAIGRVY